MTAYATLADLKAYAGIEGNTNDALLTNLLESATAMCRSYTSQEFSPVTETRVFDINEPRVEVVGDTLYLWSESMLEATEVELDGGTTILPAQFRLLPMQNDAKYKVKLLDGLGWSGEYVAITGKFGRTLTPPEDIKQSVVRLAHFLFKQKDNASGDTDRPIVTPEGLTVMPAAIPADVVAIWSKWRSLL